MINLVEPSKIAVQSLWGNKLRTSLTTMGVVIGVSAVITLVSMGEGAKTYVLDQVRGWGIGPNTIAIGPGKEDASVPEMTLTIEDANAIKQIKNVIYVVPEVIGRGRLKYGKNEYTPPYTLGMTEDYPNAYNQKVADGRFFTKAEIDGRRHVIVIGKNTARKLFKSEFSPIGEKIKVNNIGFTVIGVLEEKGTLLFTDMDDVAYIPISTSENVLGTKQVWDMTVMVENEDQVPKAVEDITRLLTKRHRKEDFHLHTQQGMIDMINNILNALTGIVSAIAAISLLVGGIGIMNIMLVAVTERTREIGIRKSIGAKKRDIFLQFVFESVLITLTGAVMGILLGTFSAWGIMAYLKMSAVIAWGAAYLACLVAVIVGLFFGVYPAMRAARLDPIEALRFEV